MSGGVGRISESVPRNWTDSEIRPTWQSGRVELLVSMCQTLFHIPATVAGYPVFGFGLLLALWAVASVITLAVLARRQGFNADTWGYVPILLLIGAIIAWLLPRICEVSPAGVSLGLPIRGYGAMMLLAVVSGTVLAAWRAKRVGLNPDLIFTLIFWMLIPGIIGARGFYVIEYWSRDYWPAYADKGGSLGALLGNILNLTQGGLVVYGAFIGGLLGNASFRSQVSTAVAGPGRSDCPVDAAGFGHRPRGVPAERLLLRRRVRSSLGDRVSRHFAGLPRPGRARPDVRVRRRRQLRRCAVSWC